MYNRNKPRYYRKSLFVNLLTEMLRYDPEDRITLSEIRNHPWYKGDIAKKSEVKHFMKNLRL